METLARDWIQQFQKKIRGIREPFAEGLRLPYVRDGDVEQQR
jgi:hypothetical protein